jgi:hypothetical protein
MTRCCWRDWKTSAWPVIRILERINAKLMAEARDPLTYEAVKAQVHGAFGRPHIATALIDRGYVPDMNTAFKDYLIPCNVPKFYMPADEALGLIRQARGISSVAHPRFITTDPVRLRQVIQELQADGLDGIEAYHHDHGAEERLYFIRLANQLGMTITGGSDYHGFKTKNAPTDSGGKLGSLRLPYGFAVRLRRVYLHRYPTLLLLLGWPQDAAAAICRAFEVHYLLPSMQWSQAPHVDASVAGNWPEHGSLVVNLAATELRQIHTMITHNRAQGRHIVGLPWQTAVAERGDGFYQASSVSLERFRRTTAERLAHELVHEAILCQLV